MADYVIFTDSACDISKEILSSWGVKSTPLTFRLSGDDKIYCDGEVDIKAFYHKMRDGLVPKTAAVNPEDFINAFEKELILGRDVIYIGFSSGLSATYNSAIIARDI
ncbi:MAG: DegV family protein, partial [Clostridia bacterium]|nr:DegV family protein [Clostridia bacterium]